MRKIYLKRKDLEEAKKEYFDKLEKYFKRVDIEYIDTEKSLGRITALPIFSNENLPSYNSAAMDGIAVLSEKTKEVNENNPKILKRGQDFEFINTGERIPSKYDAVIMIENVEVLNGETVMIRESAYPYQNVRKIGEDVSKYEMILPRFHKITPPDISLMLSSMVFEITVIKKLKTVFIPTGKEIVKPKNITDKFSQIPESNSFLVGGFLKKFPVEYSVLDPIEDDFQEMEKVLKHAVDKFDIVFINAGTSAGSKDITYKVIEKMGEIIVHGINVMPGKPVILAAIDSKPVIGLPGYPVAVQIVLDEIIKDLMMKKLKIRTLEEENNTIKCVFSKRWKSSASIDEFIRVQVGKVNKIYVAIPLKRGSANLYSLSKEDGRVRKIKGKEVIDDREEIYVKIKKSIQEIENNIIILGSHDILIDLLADFIRKYDYRYSIVSSNLGSFSGIISIYKGYAHLAGMHLLHPESGEYNIPYVRKYIKDYYLITLAFREQGLIVQKGNPKNIKGFKDLKRKDISFINRQKSSGTRLLLDYKLKEYGIDGSEIKGYENEEYSHTNLALKISEGMADVGLGIKASAKIFDLDFIPIAKERYELLVHESFLKDKRLNIIMDIITSNEFKKRAEELEGYDMSETGKIRKGW